MLDAALIEKCADPSLKPAIVEQFVKAAGSPDPLAITVRSGDRIILVPKPANAEEALAIIRENVAHSVVRVGVTQVPAGLGAKEVSDLKPDLVDTCENLKMGTRMFAKVMRIVAKWYGNPKSDEVFPQIFEDAVFAWKSGEFEGTNVFLADDTAIDWKPPEVTAETPPGDTDDEPQDGEQASKTTDVKADVAHDDEAPDNADMRIDLSRIGSGQ